MHGLDPGTTVVRLEPRATVRSRVITSPLCSWLWQSTVISRIDTSPPVSIASTATITPPAPRMASVTRESTFV